MLGLCRLVRPGVVGLVAAVAVEATRRLAALVAEEGGMEFPAALRAAGEAVPHPPPATAFLGQRQRHLARRITANHTFGPPSEKVKSLRSGRTSALVGSMDSMTQPWAKAA